MVPKNAQPAGPPPDGTSPRRDRRAAKRHHRRHQLPDIGRRRLLVTLGGTLAVTAFRANIAADYQLTERSQYRVTTPDDAGNRAAAKAFPDAAWYLLGGFRVTYGQAAAKLRALQPAMNQRAPASYIGYSNEGIDIAQLFISIQRDVYARKLSRVYLYGDSFGGMAAAVLASLLEQNDIHVVLIVMGSSPSSVRDVLDPSKQYISLAGTVVPYLGLAGRLAAGVWSGLANPNGQGMYDAVRSGVNGSLNPENNSLILSTSQATFLAAFPEQYDGGISPSTGIGLIYDPEDFIVNAPQAMRGWRALLPENTFFQYNVPHTGHACPEIHPELYDTALSVVQDVLAPLPRTAVPPQPFF